MKRVNATIQINFLCMLLPPPFCAHKTTLNQFIRNWQKSFSIFLQKKTKRTKFFFFCKKQSKNSVQTLVYHLVRLEESHPGARYSDKHI